LVSYTAVLKKIDGVKNIGWVLVLTKEFVPLISRGLKKEEATERASRVKELVSESENRFESVKESDVKLLRIDEPEASLLIYDLGKTYMVVSAPLKDTLIVATMVEEFISPLSCPNCGFELSTKQWRCPKCDSIIPFASRSCPYCGREIEYHVCPSCSEKITPDGRIYQWWEPSKAMIKALAASITAIVILDVALIYLLKPSLTVAAILLLLSLVVPLGVSAVVEKTSR